MKEMENWDFFNINLDCTFKFFPIHYSLSGANTIYNLIAKFSWGCAIITDHTFSPKALLRSDSLKYAIIFSQSLINADF